jgi:ABC-type phosphate/phosphonate transport system substrate-binding protein
VAPAAGLAGLLCVLAAAADETDRDQRVRIGMVGTLFRDTPQPLVVALMRPFGSMMESQTGMAGKLVPGGDALSMARQLDQGRLQLGIFHGVEFAWAQQRYPQLRPLIIAINQDRHLWAALVVRSDRKEAGVADLKGQVVAFPRGSREHVHLFFDRLCQGAGGQPAELFATVTKPANAEVALDDVLDNDVRAAVVDGLALDCFKRRKPGRFARLRVVVKSEVFPAAVLAYKPGALAEDKLDRFRQGLLRAHRTATGRQLMTLWKLTAFEPVPDDYQATLDQIIKAYPAPVSAAR